MKPADEESMAGLDSAYQPSCPRTKLLRLRDLLHDGDTGDQALALVEELLHSDLDQPSTTAEDDPSSRFFDNNHAMMLLLDPATGCLVDANPAAAKYYGWSREEMRGKPIFEINTLSRQEIKAAMSEAVEGKRNLFHFLHRRADGSLCNVDILSGKIRYHGRELLYSIVHDAGERRAAEEKLAATGVHPGGSGIWDLGVADSQARGDDQSHSREHVRVFRRGTGADDSRSLEVALSSRRLS